jgi:CheY-like chemotaxis protein
MNKGLPLEARAAVLVVDDELVRILTVQALEEAGFRVEEAGNSDEMLSRLTCRVLWMDVDSPGACVSCSHRSP